MMLKIIVCTWEMYRTRGRGSRRPPPKSVTHCRARDGGEFPIIPTGLGGGIRRALRDE